MKRNAVFFLFPLGFLIVAGCAPQRYVDGIAFAAERYRVRDAAASAVSGKGHLRFDSALRSDLDDAIAANDLPTIQTLGAEVIRKANALAITSAAGEIDRLHDEGLAYLVRQYQIAGAPTDTTSLREFLKREFAAAARPALNDDLTALEAARDVNAARVLLSSIRRRIEVPVADGGKFGRALLAAPLFIPASIGVETAEHEAMQRQVVADFKQVVEYRPPHMQDGPDDAALTQADSSTLARWFAPVFVQEVDAHARYDAAADRIGRVFLSGAPDAIQVHVETADPAVYWTHLDAKIGDRKYEQLVYVAWYPSRPALAPNDPEAGHIDGVVVRITLDRHHRPAIYEFVRSCGCYHTLWVAEFVEAMARKQYGSPAKNQRFAVQRAVTGKELFFPDLVRDDGTHPRRPVAFVSAGHHLLMGVTPLDDRAVRANVISRRTYRLEPYEVLTHLPLGGGVASMFGSDGLVHGAGRLEGWLLAPTGMLSAGQPRQIGTMKIRMDAYDYDDPRLLERNLRLPDDF